jgi:hypothetical protein|tara:strand:+ start:288 stop:1661 length:1374 start_codon:yes stop_codon:yes gene_type:complete
MATQIQLRRDTAADWTSNNPTLAAGEFGWESDSNRFKIGDGSAAWTSLSYADTLKTLGDILVNGSTISAPSNGDLTLTTSGTGNINLGEFIVNGTTLSSSDSSSININEGLIVDGALNVSGTATLSGATNLSSTLAVPSGLTTLSTLSVTSTTSLVGTTTIDNLTFNDNTIGSSSNADINLTPGGTGNVVAGGLTFNGTTMSAADSSSININEGLIVDGTLNVSGAATLSGLAYPTSDGTVGQVLQTDGSGTLSFASISIGDLSIVGSSILSPSSADLTLNSSNGNVVIEGIKVAGTTLSTEDSTPGIEIAGNLIPSQNGVFQLGSSTRRWQTLFVAAETIDLGGATIKSDGSGQIEIAASGATFPTGSKVGDQSLVLGGKTNKTGQRPVQIVQIFVSDGSTNKSDAQFLAGTADLELEFNGTVEDVPVFTEANQSFDLSDGTTLLANAGGATLFQF